MNDDEHDRYGLRLDTTSVRQKLKICLKLRAVFISTP